MVAIRAFISYKSEYRDLATRVRDKLQSWGHGTWFDQDDIGKGEYFRDEIQNGLENSDVVIGLVTKEALKSREVLTEWDYAFSGNSRLLLLRYQDVELPYWLKGIQHIDCMTNLDKGFEQLQIALGSSDTSHTSTETAPEFITRHKAASVDLQYQAPTKTASKKNSRDEQNRENMLQNVHQAWIEGVLHPNLEAGAFDIEVGLKADSVLRYADYSEYQLPESGRDIGQIFHDMNGELLILGKPGSGKTILLLRLAEHLLAKAQNDPKQPIPVVFNLSSWSAKRDSLDKWLNDELRRSYQVPKKTAESLKITLLLDGLDEVAENVRDNCVAAINQYRNQNKEVDIVVCSRIGDYKKLSKQLDLNGAILLQDLSDEQIQDYLKGESFAGIRDLLENEASAHEMANTPFLLNTMKATYENISYTGNPHNRLKLEDTSEKMRRDHLFDFNIQQRLVGQTQYTSDKTLHYLKWLAWQMVQHDTTTFYIEDLQPDWITSQWKKRLFFLVNIIIIGLAFSLVIHLLFYQLFGFWNYLSISSFVIGLVFGIAFTFQNKYLFSIGIALIITMILGYSPLGVPIIGNTAGLSAAIIGFFLFNHINKDSKSIKMTDSVQFKLPPFIIILILLVVGIVIVILMNAMILASFAFLKNSLAMASAFGLASIATALLLLSLQSNRIGSKHRKPSYGIRYTLVYSIIMGVVLAVIFGVGVFFPFVTLGKLAPEQYGFTISFSFARVGFISGFVFFGGSSVLKHLTLRIISSIYNVIPRWRYDHFLDYAASVGILRRVGGGYIFRHRMLLEYFAEQWEKENN